MRKCKKTPLRRDSQSRSDGFVATARRLRLPAGMALIALLVFVCYFPSLSGGFIWDDEMLITRNHFIQAADGLYGLWCTTQTPDYWPITNTSFWIEWRVWGTHTTGYHVVNLLLHIAACGLIWRILRRLSIPGAFFAALLFAVHPVNVESVAWIAQRKNTLSMLFFLLSVLCYLKFEEKKGTQLIYRNGPQGAAHKLAASPFSCLFYWLSFAAFILAMLSKGSVAVLPALLLGIIWWRRTGTVPIFASAKMGLSPSVSSWDLARTAPFFTVAAILTLVNIWFQRHDIDRVIRDAGFLERLLAAGALIWFYLYKAFFPLNLVFVYPQWSIQTGDPLWWLPLAAVLIVTALLWQYRQGWSRPLLFAWGFFCTALLPALGFTDVGFMRFSLVADRYQHIAIIGMIALTAAGWSCWRQRGSRTVRRTADVVAVVAVCALTLLACRQSGLYRNSITLYRATLEKNPNCWVLLDNLGDSLLHSNQPVEAIEYYLKAIKLRPNDFDAHNNLAEAYEKTGRLPQAVEYYREAVKLRPKSAEVHNNLGIALVEFNRPQEAIEHFKEALQIKPDFIEAYNNWAFICAKTNQSAQAIALAEKALSIARSEGRADLAGQIEKWLDSYRKDLSVPKNPPPTDKPSSLPP